VAVKRKGYGGRRRRGANDAAMDFLKEICHHGHVTQVSKSVSRANSIFPCQLHLHLFVSTVPTSKRGHDLAAMSAAHHYVYVHNAKLLIPC
jgi:hypothetical protein